MKRNISDSSGKKGRFKYKISYSPIDMDELIRRNSIDLKNKSELRGWNKTTERNKSFLDPEILGTTVSPSAKRLNTSFQNSSRQKNDLNTRRVHKEEDLNLHDYLRKSKESHMLRLDENVPTHEDEPKGEMALPSEQQLVSQMSNQKSVSTVNKNTSLLGA